MTSSRDAIQRRSVSVPGGMCAVRLGHQALSVLGSSLVSYTGRPKRALVVAQDSLQDELVERICHQLSDAGYLPQLQRLGSGNDARSFESIASLFAMLQEASITSDDVVLAAGNSNVLSACSFAAGLWCGGVTCVFVPSDVASAIEPVATPLGIHTASDTASRVQNNGYPRLCIIDLDELSFELPSALLARAYMVSTAMATGDVQLGGLGSRAQAIEQFDVDVTGEQILDTLRFRGRLACSNAVAMRQALHYGTSFAEALRRLAPELNYGLCISEGLRFSSRLAAGLVEDFDIELIYAQDALLDRLGLDEVALHVEPAQLQSSLQKVCFERSNRFMLPIPHDMGKVRLASIPQELLVEHLEAWCASRARNLEST